MSKKFIVRDTKKYGKGVFATRPIAKGEVIHTLSGQLMTIYDFIERVNADKENIDDPLQVGKRTYLDLDALSRTFNHSCDPNAGLRKKSELIAIKNIAVGDEITYDYSLTIAPTEWGMRCKCGSKKCRKILGDVLSIPASTRKYYRASGIIQDYMRRLLDTIKKEGRYVMPPYEKKLLQSLKKTSNL